jgi:hypothetical protein
MFIIKAVLHLGDVVAGRVAHLSVVALLESIFDIF